MLSERAASQALQELLDQPAFAQITRLNRERDTAVYVVGGAIRDVLLGRPVGDVDFVVTGLDGPALERRLRRIGPTVLAGKRFGVYKVRPRGATVLVDVALPRVEHITGRGGYQDVIVTANADVPLVTDLARRDFTINALAFDIRTGELLDPHAGRADLEKNVVRTVGDPAERFAEDYTRVLRAVRFAVQLGFTIEPKTKAALTAVVKKINASDRVGRLVAYELIGKEVGRMFAADGVRALRLLIETGLLTEVLPEVAALRGIEQYKKFHPEGDVLVHTEQALERLYQQADQAGSQRPTFNEIIATLLHDVGKAERVQIKDLTTGKRREIADPHQFFKSSAYDPRRDRVMNIGHAEAGVAIARRIFKRLALGQLSADPDVRFDQNEVLHVIRYHLLQNTSEMRPSKVEHILFYPDGRVRWSLLRVARADAGDRPGPLGSDRYRSALNRIHELLAAKLSSAEPRLAEPLLSGADLIELGAEPGPRFKAVLAAVRDAQLAGRITTKKEAKQLAGQFLQKVHL